MIPSIGTSTRGLNTHLWIKGHLAQLATWGKRGLLMEDGSIVELVGRSGPVRMGRAHERNRSIPNT